MKGKKLKISKQVRVYNFYIKPVLTYNSSAGAVNKNIEAKIDAFHRKKLKRVISIYYPNRISNKELYKKTNSIPLSVEIAGARWRMLGHILRRPDTPSFQAMKQYYATSNKKKYLGRPLTTLSQTLKEDIKLIPKNETRKLKRFRNHFSSCPTEMFLEKNCEESYPRETQSTIRLEQLDGDIIIIIFQTLYMLNTNKKNVCTKCVHARKETVYIFFN